MKVFEKLIIAALIVFPFGELLRFEIGNNVVIKPLDILAGITLMTWTILVIAQKIKLKKSDWVFLLFPFVGLLSLLFALFWLQPHGVVISSLYLIRWVSYLGIYFAVRQCSAAFRKTIISLLLFDGIVIVLFGFFQYFFFNSLRPLYFLGWDDHMYRLFSVFLDPNYTGGIVALFLVFVSGLLYQQYTKRNSQNSNSTLFHFFHLRSKSYYIFLSIIGLVTLIALFFTFSRSSLLMLILGASIFFILIGRKNLILVLLLSILVFILLMSSKFDVESINLFRINSSNARIANAELAYGIFQKHPLVGVGFNTYRYTKDYYNIRSGWVKAPSHADAGVDNSFLFTLVTTGIIGIAAYLLLWFTLLKRAYAAFRKDKNIFALIFISSALGLFVHALFINSLFFPAIMFWMWVMLGLMEKN